MGQASIIQSPKRLVQCGARPYAIADGIVEVEVRKLQSSCGFRSRAITKTTVKTSTKALKGLRRCAHTIIWEGTATVQRNFHKSRIRRSQDLHNSLLSYLHSVGAAVMTAPHEFSFETSIGRAK
jgi:hypothetical protein